MTSRIPSVQGVVGGVRARAGRTAARAVNAARLAGGLDRPATGCTAHSVVSRRDRTSLRRFQSSGERRRSPVLLVPSLINRSRIWDLRPGDSFVEGMLAAGYDVYLMDWGTIDERDATNTLSTYVDGYIPSAVDRVEQLSGALPILIGHCLGGIMATLWAASTDRQPPALVSIAAPTNWAEMGPLYQLTRAGRLEPEAVLDSTGNVPAKSMLRAFQMLRPLGDLTGYVTLWERMYDRAAAQAIYALTDWAHDHVPFPGATFVEMIRRLSRENGLYNGEVVLGGQPRRLKDISAPFFNVYGTHDHVTPPDSVRPLTDLVGSQIKTERDLSAGHVGLLVGGTARRKTLPAITEWLDEVIND